MKYSIQSLSCAVIVTLSTLLTACSDESSSSAKEEATPPSVIYSQVKNVAINPSRRFVGRTEAVEDVKIKARVSGYLLAMTFDEGQHVDEGDLLFEIDPKPYETEVSRLSADVKRQQAALTNAKRNFERGNELITKGFISAMEMDDLTSSRDQAEAALASSNAALESAKLNLSYTKITAPIAGQIGRKAPSIGDLVGPESGDLVSIVTVDPMYVTFDVSEKLVSAANRGRNATESNVDKLPIPTIILPNGEAYEHQGKFDFIDNRVDRATGTVKVRAVFPNTDGLLIPGQYVTAVVSARNAEQAILVPQAAVSEDQQGKFVMVIDQEDKVQVRRVEMGDRTDVSWVAESGLEEGERIIVEGLQKVRTGQKVNPVEQTMKAFDSDSKQ